MLGAEMRKILLKKNPDHERQSVKVFLLRLESVGPSQFPYQSISGGISNSLVRI